MSVTINGGAPSAPQIAEFKSVFDLLGLSTAALSVKANATNAAAPATDVAAGTDGHVLRRSGTTLGFGTLPAGAYASNTIPLTAVANITAQSVLANATGSGAAPTAIALAASQLLGRGSTGNVAAISIGSGLTMTGTTLSAPGGGGTVTSVGMSVPTGLSISGSPITGAGTLAVSLTAGYVIPTQATLDSKLDANLASEITTAKTSFSNTDKGILLDAADSENPKTFTGAVMRTAPVGAGLATTGTVDLDLAALTGTIQTITATGNITFTTSNRVAGRAFELRIAAGGASRTLTWPAWVAFGAALPTTLASGKALRLAISCTGTTDASIDAAAAESV